MANYYGTGRSNYFRVKDREKFEEALAALPVTVVESRSDQSLIALLDGNDNGDGWIMYDYEAEEDVDYVELVAPHLADGEVCIMAEVGTEKYRYLVGWAVAFNNKGVQVSVDLENIYTLAQGLGKNVTRAEY